MQTATIQIGNSDDKLTQKEWSEFVASVDAVVRSFAEEVHFFGVSGGDRPWQNACWVASVQESNKGNLASGLAKSRLCFHQDSVAVTFGYTAFI